jgi:hypothetical protein
MNALAYTLPQSPSPRINITKGKGLKREQTLSKMSIYAHVWLSSARYNAEKRPSKRLGVASFPFLMARGREFANQWMG